MRRRRPLLVDLPPERLLRFDPSEWPASDVREAFGLWKAAVWLRLESHGWERNALGVLLHILAEHDRFWPRARPRQRH